MGMAGHGRVGSFQLFEVFLKLVVFFFPHGFLWITVLSHVPRITRSSAWTCGLRLRRLAISSVVNVSSSLFIGPSHFSRGTLWRRVLAGVALQDFAGAVHFLFAAGDRLGVRGAHPGRLHIDFVHFSPKAHVELAFAE